MDNEKDPIPPETVPSEDPEAFPPEDDEDDGGDWAGDEEEEEDEEDEIDT